MSGRPSPLSLVPLLLGPLLASPATRPEDQADGEVEGLALDPAAGVVGVSATVGVKDELLEYLLVSPHGAAHESLFQTTVRPSLVNAALLATGAEPGRNARYAEETGEVLPPEGPGFFLYVAWREGEETFLYRVDDLVANLATGRSMRRHRWVFLGSRFAVLRDGEGESFVADAEGNLINISFFYQGNTLVTAGLPECTSQTIWIGNQWILPARGAPVELIFARRRLDDLPAAIAEHLPEVPPAVETGH